MLSDKECERLKNEIITEQNRLRTNPKSYIPKLEKCIKCFKGNVYEKPGTDIGIETTEGPMAYQEAINFLKTQKPIRSLTYDEEISKASQSHAKDIGETGGTDYIGSDGLSNSDRVGKFVNWDANICESIDFGGVTGEEVMISFLVDDGVSDRSHRGSIFNTKLNYFGVGVAKHKEYEICSVIDYVGEIVSYVDESKNGYVRKPSPLKKSLLRGELSSGAINTLLMQAKKKEMIKNEQSAKQEKGGAEEEEEDNPFKDDPDAPEGCISCKKKVSKKKVGKTTIVTTEKTYTLEDGTEEVVTLEETVYE